MGWKWVDEGDGPQPNQPQPGGAPIQQQAAHQAPVQQTGGFQPTAQQLAQQAAYDRSGEQRLGQPVQQMAYQAPQQMAIGAVQQQAAQPAPFANYANALGRRMRYQQPGMQRAAMGDQMAAQAAQTPAGQQFAQQLGSTQNMNARNMESARLDAFAQPAQPNMQSQDAAKLANFGAPVMGGGSMNAQNMDAARRRDFAIGGVG